MKSLKQCKPNFAFKVTWIYIFPSSPPKHNFSYWQRSNMILHGTLNNKGLGNGRF